MAKEPTNADLLDAINSIKSDITDIKTDISHINRKLDRHTEILVQTQQAVSGLQRHLGLVPV